jgi:hypothetical protein
MEPPDVIRRPCMGLPPGAPCPTVKLGTWPQDCVCYQEGYHTTEFEMKNYDRNIRNRLVLVGVIAVSLVACILIRQAYGADVDKSCMTKAQAQAAHPGKWLYWHGPRHCWDDKPGRFTTNTHVVYGKTNSLKLARPALDPNGNVAHHSGKPLIDDAPAPGPSIYYPSLMTGAGTDDAMLRAEAMTTWPAIADFDIDPPAFLPWQRRISFFVAPATGGEPDLIATTHEEAR